MTDPWLRDVPAVFRALADSRLESAIPRPATGALEQAWAHWGALHYTLSSLLAWADVGRRIPWRKNKNAVPCGTAFQYSISSEIRCFWQTWQRPTLPSLET